MVYSEAFRGSRNSACTLDWTLRPNSIEMDGTVLSKPIKRGFEALFSHTLYTDHSCLARYLTLFPQNVCVSLIPAVEKSDDNDGIFVVLKNDVNEVFKAASNLNVAQLGKDARIHHTCLARRWLKTLRHECRAVFVDRMVASLSLFSTPYVDKNSVRLPEWAKEYLKNGNQLPVAFFVVTRAVSDAFAFMHDRPVGPLHVRYVIDIFALMLLVPCLYRGLIKQLREMKYWGDVFPFTEKGLYCFMSMPLHFQFKEGQSDILAGLAETLIVVHDMYLCKAVVRSRQRNYSETLSLRTYDCMLKVVSLIRQLLTCIDVIEDCRFVCQSHKTEREAVWRIGLLNDCFCNTACCYKCQLRTRILDTLKRKCSVTLL